MNCPKMDIVECHSGFTYAEKPVALTWEGMHLAIHGVLACWRTPGERHFEVRTCDQRVFKLVYCETTDQWQIYNNLEVG
jgi:hypothetical protein